MNGKTVLTLLLLLIGTRAWAQPTGPGGSEGQFFGHVGGMLFLERCDETKWCSLWACFCR